MDDQKPLTVVIVDDVACILALVAESIRTIAGIKVIATVSTIALAMDAIQQLQPDVAILDISMPSFREIHNGIDLLKWIKAYHSQIDVIMLTNQSGSGYLEGAKQLGAYAFLDKSGDPDLLHRALRQLVQVHANRRVS